MEKLKLSYSKINTFLNCRMKYHWIYNERLYPKAKAYPLKLGIIVHRMLHLWQIDKLTKEHIDNIVRDITNTYPETEPAEIQSLAFEATTLVRGYVEKYEESDPLKVVSSEMILELEREDYVLYTRLDGIVRSQDDRLWRWEHKTTKQMNSAYLTGLKGGLQAGIAYIVVANTLPEKVSGTVYNLLVKTKVPQYYRNFVTAERLLVDRTERCITGVVKDIKQGDFYPSLACYTYNSECPYLKLCQQDTPMTREAFFVKREDVPREEETLLKIEEE